MVKKKEDIPKWVTDEIQNAKFGKPKEETKTGYILEVYDKDGKADAQLYEAVEDGRHIVTLELPKNIKSADLERGVVYEFTLESLKASLSKKAVDFLKKEKEIEMEAIYQFNLIKLEQLDVGSSESSEDVEE
jgi:hypothetical protein